MYFFERVLFFLFCECTVCFFSRFASMTLKTLLCEYCLAFYFIAFRAPRKNKASIDLQSFFLRFFVQEMALFTSSKLRIIVTPARVRSFASMSKQRLLVKNMRDTSDYTWRATHPTNKKNEKRKKIKQKEEKWYYLSLTIRSVAWASVAAFWLTDREYFWRLFWLARSTESNRSEEKDCDAISTHHSNVD